MYTLNINDYVRVRLNNYGRSILIQKRTDLNELIRKAGGEGLGEISFKVDAEGYSEKKMQLHSFMHTFGHYMTFSDELPFHEEIEII